MAANAKPREERVKLVATALSNLGVASLVTGFIAPVLAGHMQILATSAAVILGLALHLCGQAVLHFVVRQGGAFRMSLAGYAFTYGAYILGALGMVAGTFIIIRLDEPKRDKKKTTHG